MRSFFERKKDGKKPFLSFFLFLFSTGMGISVFFVWQRFSDLAPKPYNSLSQIYSGGSGFIPGEDELLTEGEDDISGKAPALTSVSSKEKGSSASAALAGNAADAKRSGGSAQGKDAGGETNSSAGYGSGVKPRLAASLPGAGAGSGGKSSSFGGRSLSENSEAGSGGAGSSNSSLLQKAFSALKRGAKIGSIDLLSHSGESAKHNSGAVFGEGHSGAKGLDSYKQNTGIKDIHGLGSDLKLESAKTLAVPDVSPPDRDIEAEKKDALMNSLMAELAKKGSDPTSGLVNPALGGPAGAGSQAAQRAGSGSGSTYTPPKIPAEVTNTFNATGMLNGGAPKLTQIDYAGNVQITATYPNGKTLTQTIMGESNASAYAKEFGEAKGVTLAKPINGMHVTRSADGAGYYAINNPDSINWAPTTAVAQQMCANGVEGCQSSAL